MKQNHHWVLLFREIRVMNKKYILIIVSVILIGMIVISYAHNKQKKKTITLETQEKRIDFFLSITLNHYKSLK